MASNKNPHNATNQRATAVDLNFKIDGTGRSVALVCSSIMYTVKIILTLRGGWAERMVTMPIMPVGTLVDCVPELDETLEISHWVFVPASDGYEASIACHLQVDGWGFDEPVESEGETFSEWLKRVGFSVYSTRNLIR